MMNNDFKKRLYDLYYDTSADPAKIRAEAQYEQSIASGAAAEYGENFFLYFYLAASVPRPRYEAILMLYNMYAPVSPVDIHFSDSRLTFDARDKWIRTAVFFLRKQHKKTLKMDLFNLPETKQPEEIQRVLSFAKQMHQAHKKKQKHLDKEMRAFKKTGFNQQLRVEVEKITPPKSTKLPSQLQHRLEALEEHEAPQQEPEPQSRRRALANVGVCLETCPNPGTDDPQVFHFHPVIVPVLKKGGCGKPRKATRSLMGIYRVDVNNLPEILQDFLDRFVTISSDKLYDPLKVKLLNRVFFQPVAQQLHKLPDVHTFYLFTGSNYDEDGKKYRPMKKIDFQKVAVKFVPSIEREKYFSVCLELVNQEGQTFRTGSTYQVAVMSKEIYLFFTDPNGTGYFAVPDNADDFLTICSVLSGQKEFPVEHFKGMVKYFKSLQSPNLTVIPEPLKKYKLHYFPVPMLKITEKNQFTGAPDRLKLEFDYAGPARMFKAENPNMHPLVMVGREDPQNRAFENICLHVLKEDPQLQMEQLGSTWSSKEGCYFHFKDKNSLEWLTSSGSSYLEKGFKLFSTAWNRAIGKVGSEVHVSMDHGIRWLEFKPSLQDNENGELIDVADVDLKQGIAIDAHGTLHLLTAKELEKIKRLYQYAEKHGDIFRLPSENYMLINKLYDDRMDQVPHLNSRFRTARKLNNLDDIPDYAVSHAFNGTLRAYQHSGYRWLRFLHQHDFAGCLADDMGLGKTVQTLALLQSLKNEGQLTTSVLVAPVSALPNWQLEIERFAPDLSQHLHIGIKREKSNGSWKNFDLLLTSYATLRQDIEMFKAFKFDYIILDESQNIKNASSQVSRAVKVLESKHRLALSGTPVENNSMELWSMFDFLIPGFLGPSQWFSNHFAVPVEKEGNAERAAVLKQMVYPFILRRKKEDVEIELPEKTEIISHLQMDGPQMELYRKVAENYRKEVEQEIDGKGVAASAIKVMEAMLRLRQICLFPHLAHPEYEGIPSAKFQHFTELIEDIVSEGHKVLIFSQFVQVLNNIRQYLDKEQIRYVSIDGSVNIEKRGERIARFQEDDSISAFLLSLKAGGTAINLTAADYVIIFDPWWNPAVEAQAVDRSHRIGQKRNVFVYRLVTANTIEEKMIALQQKKKELVDQLISTDPDSRKFKNLSKVEILDLFTVT